MERFDLVLFFIGLIMAAIFWLPEKLGLGLENSTFCLAAAVITDLVLVLRPGVRKR